MKFLVFFWDTMRADHASCYGYPRQTTLNLDRLAEEGFLFENATSVTGHTGPTFTAYVTGQYPLTHNVVSTFFAHPNLKDDRVDDTTPVLAGVLHKNCGYLTAAFDNLATTWASHPEWMARGNDYYVSTTHPDNEFCCWVLAEHINARLIPFVEAHKDRNFFIFVHYWDPHQPYNQPDPFRTYHANGSIPNERQSKDGRSYIPTWGWTENLAPEHREKIDLYDGDITYCDAEFGKVIQRLKEIGIYDDTTIIVTADHGEDMYEHNAPLEHRETYRSTVGVPFVVKPAKELGLASPRRIEALISPIDIAPSILDVVGAEIPVVMQGSSWLPLLRGSDGPIHEHVFSTGVAVVQKGFWRVAEIAVRTNTHKLIRRGKATLEPEHTKLNTCCLGAPPFRGDPKRPLKDRFDFHNAHPKFELYDLVADPYEVDNIAEARPKLVQELNGLIDDYIATNPRRWIEAAEDE